jgi:hypothetical protein
VEKDQTGAAAGCRRRPGLLEVLLGVLRQRGLQDVAAVLAQGADGLVPRHLLLAVPIALDHRDGLRLDHPIVSEAVTCSAVSSSS